MHTLNGVPDVADNEDACLINCLNVGWCSAVDWNAKGSQNNKCFFSTTTSLSPVSGSGIIHAVYSCSEGDIIHFKLTRFTHRTFPEPASSVRAQSAKRLSVNR